MTGEEATRVLSMHLMQCGMLMPIEWVQKNGEGSKLHEAMRMALDSLCPATCLNDTSDTIKKVEELISLHREEETFERLGATLYEQIISDDESWVRKAKDVWNAYRKDPELIDEILTSLCGWKMESLLEFSDILSDNQNEDEEKEECF